MFCRIRKNNGFTLMEILIVVAIVAILVAIAIPVFSSQLENARAATCQANQRGLKAAVSAAYLSNNNDRPEAAKSGVESMSLDSSGLVNADPVFSIMAASLCPDGGRYTITFNEGSIDVACSKHGSSKLLGEDQAVMDQLVSKLPEIECDSAGSREDSGQHTATLLAALEKSGINLDALGAASWAWRPATDSRKNPKFYWSSVDISDPSMLDKAGIPLMSYNPNTKLYMVYTGTVGTTNYSNGNVFVGNPQAKSNGKSFEDAYAEYQALMNDYNKKP